MQILSSGLACIADTDFMLIAGGFDGVNRLSSAEILRVGSVHTVPIESMPTPRFGFVLKIDQKTMEVT